MEQSIEEKTVKISIKQIAYILFAVIGSTITVVCAVYNYKNQNSNGISELKTEVREIKSDFELFTTSQKNDSKLKDNYRQRDSAITTNKIDQINETLIEIKNSINQNRYRYGFVMSEK